MLVPPSPNVHAYRITSPSTSTVAALLKVQVVYVGQLDVNAATGAVLLAGSTRLTVAGGRGDARPSRPSW